MRKTRYDLKGIPFAHPAADLEPKEVSKIVHEINNVYDTKYKGKPFAMHRSIDLQNRYCIYYFENRGFSDYNIIGKMYD